MVAKTAHTLPARPAKGGPECWGEAPRRADIISHQPDSPNEASSSGSWDKDHFDSNKLEDEADVLACMAYVDLNPIRSRMVDSLDAADANVSIAERLRGLDDEPVDSASWLAPLELASEVDGQPAVVASVPFCPSAQLETLVPKKWRIIRKPCPLRPETLH